MASKTKAQIAEELAKHLNSSVVNIKGLTAALPLPKGWKHISPNQPPLVSKKFTGKGGEKGKTALKKSDDPTALEVLQLIFDDQFVEMFIAQMNARMKKGQKIKDRKKEAMKQMAADIKNTKIPFLSPEIQEMLKTRTETRIARNAKKRKRRGKKEVESDEEVEEDQLEDVLAFMLQQGMLYVQWITVCRRRQG